MNNAIKTPGRILIVRRYTVVRPLVASFRRRLSVAVEAKFHLAFSLQKTEKVKSPWPMFGVCMPDENRPRPSFFRLSRTSVCAAAVFLVALGLRLAASRGDLVLDEVWTRRIVSETDSAWKVPLLGTDNNHILNTLVVYALGLTAPPYAYRLPAALAGSIALWFGYLLARRDRPAAGLVVLTLLGFSHPLVVFCTEARGYAFLACFTLVAWWSLENYLDHPKSWSAATFAIASSLGFFSHLTFAFAYAGFGLYSVIRLWPRRGGWKKCLYLHLLPAMTFVFLYVAFIEKMGIGGGAQYPLQTTLLATFSLLAGGPERGGSAIFAAGIAALLIAVSLVFIVYGSRARGMLFLTAMFLAPTVVLWLSPWIASEVVYPRYFLVPMLFAYVAVGCFMARQCGGQPLGKDRARGAGAGPKGSPGFGRWSASLLLAVFVICNFVPVVRLIVGGRGQYSAAVLWMAEHSAEPFVTLASDHDIRNPAMIEYYAGRERRDLSDRGRQLVYITRDRFPQEGTEWFLLHSFSGDPPHPNEFTTPTGVQYVLERVFPCGSISGWTWWLYRRR
jgi:hypothetical protein